MPIEHPSPTVATIKFLYAHAFLCAMEGCSRPLYKLDNETGSRTLNSRICHINARREGGPRWNSSQSSQDNRSKHNLILMCLEHAAVIDDELTRSFYSVERLHELKNQQFNDYCRIEQRWNLDAEMAREALGASESDLIITNSTVVLVSEGGRAVGAGGAGGGAIGRNARGGRGGDGGSRRIEDMFPQSDGEFAARWREIDQVLSRTAADLGFKAGAGGAGGSGVGDDLVGGAGGNGGEAVSAQIDVVELRKRGVTDIRVTVGQGGLGGRLPGQHGIEGGDTILEFINKDGLALKTVRAKGGSSTNSIKVNLPEGTNELSISDIYDGFRITTLLTADFAQVRDGVLFVNAGDWTRCDVQSIPADVLWFIIVIARWPTKTITESRGVFLSLIDPAGIERSCQTLVIPTAVDSDS